MAQYSSECLSLKNRKEKKKSYVRKLNCFLSNIVYAGGNKNQAQDRPAYYDSSAIWNIHKLLTKVTVPGTNRKLIELS